jgi:poly [ADP-ribose] polymerase
LFCFAQVLDEKSKEYKEVVAFLKKTEFRKDPDDEEDNAEQNVDDDEELIYQVTRIVKVTRAGERKAFNKKIGNERRLYHGSRISNWVGLLTRGILMPEAVLKNGGRRTDFGWLGAGS